MMLKLTTTTTTITTTTTTFSASLHYPSAFPPPLNPPSALLFSPIPKLCTSSITITAPEVFFESNVCRARWRVRYDEEEEGYNGENKGNNAEIAMMESYTQSRRDEALLVTATVDDQEAQVLVFKGYSSCLSYKTSPDPSRSVLPARTVINSIDRIRGPFDPSNIQYLEKGLTLDTFRTRI